MGKLRDLVSKGVRLIITETEEPGGRAAQPREREIPAEAFEVGTAPPAALAEVPADVADFGPVYAEAGIELPAHGYGVEKVAEMLASQRLAPLSREVRATAVLAALEAAGVPLRDVIQDAVRRDKALDDFEAAKERELQELKARGEARVRELLEQIDAFVKAKNAEIESLKKSVEAALEAFVQLQSRKRREEERLHEVVSHFIEGAENPVTKGGPGAPPPPGDAGKA